ncbi:endonuclease/exonuclease/phosphatase family protein [Rhizobium sp. RAF56]|uniref:endonuclease/exonuclease/phosphatase family protein n=1 Tax=Rhizobium sp. RAF56 TaxID=3233062 RepID=UPI003F997AA0
MSLRLATFNVENLLTRFDFTGYRNQLRQDRVLRLFDVRSEGVYQQLEQARVVAATDDTRQMTALAIADTDADIICLQEVDSLAALDAFEYGYLYRMVGSGYRQKFLLEGNDGRGIDVAVMLREETRDGQRIEVRDVKSHVLVTYRDFGLFTDELASLGHHVDDKVFKRDCLQVDLLIGDVPMMLYVVHLKSMGGAREGMDGRHATMPVRRAEALAVRRIIEDHFGAAHAGTKNFAICGDMNDYQERIDVIGTRRTGYRFEHREEPLSALDVFSADGFAENVVKRRDPMDRWTLYHARGPQEQWLCQLDYLWLSPALAKANATRKPEIIRGGQPYRTVFPPGQEIDRYPRTGWDRPKASDHCPVVMTLDLP